MAEHGLPLVGEFQEEGLKDGLPHVNQGFYQIINRLDGECRDCSRHSILLQ
jgi:hypothetical protein